MPRGTNPGDSSSHMPAGRGKLLQHDYYSFLPNEVPLESGVRYLPQQLK